MSWQTAKLVCESVCLLAVAGCAAYATWDMHETQLQARQTLQDTTAESRDMTIAVLRPCKPGPCGLVPSVNETLSGLTGTVHVLQGQAAQIGTLVTATAKAVGQAGVSVEQTATAVQGTANAATGLTAQATADLITLNGSIAATKPLINDSDTVVKGFNALLMSYAVQRMETDLPVIMDNATSMTASGKSILADSALEIHNFTHPSKKKLTFWSATEAGGDYARHFMPSIF